MWLLYALLLGFVAGVGYKIGYAKALYEAEIHYQQRAAAMYSRFVEHIKEKINNGSM